QERVVLALLDRQPPGPIVHAQEQRLTVGCDRGSGADLEPESLLGELGPGAEVGGRDNDVSEGTDLTHDLPPPLAPLGDNRVCVADDGMAMPWFHSPARGSR